MAPRMPPDGKASQNTIASFVKAFLRDGCPPILNLGKLQKMIVSDAHYYAILISVIT